MLSMPINLLLCRMPLYWVSLCWMSICWMPLPFIQPWWPYDYLLSESGLLNILIRIGPYTKSTFYYRILKSISIQHFKPDLRKWISFSLYFFPPKLFPAKNFLAKFFSRQNFFPAKIFFPAKFFPAIIFPAKIFPRKLTF